MPEKTHEEPHAGRIKITAVERALQLASSGKYQTISAIKKRVSAEGFSTDYIFGHSLYKQLNALIRAARELDRSAE